MKNFHKAASELSEDEFNSEMEQLDILSRQVVEIFFLLPLPFIPSAVISDLQVVQTCLCKLRARIKQYEDINLRPVNPIASGTSISPPTRRIVSILNLPFLHSSRHQSFVPQKV